MVEQVGGDGVGRAILWCGGLDLLAYLNLLPVALLGGIVAFTGGTLTGAFVVVEAALSGARVGFRTEMKEGDGPFLPSSVKASPYFLCTNPEAWWQLFGNVDVAWDDVNCKGTCERSVPSIPESGMYLSIRREPFPVVGQLPETLLHNTSGLIRLNIQFF